MQEKFVKQDLLSAEKYLALQVRRDDLSTRRLILQCVFMAVSLVLAINAPAGPWRWAALGLHAFSHFAFFGLLHEACHGTIFVKPRLNALAGWIAGLSHFMSPAMMRSFHFQHHRHTHEVEKDPEVIGLRFMVRWPGPLFGFAQLTGWHLLFARVGWLLFAALVPRQWLWERVLPFVRESRRSRVAREARVLMAIHGALLLLALTAVPQLQFFYVGSLLGHSILAVYTMCEHRGLPAEGGVLERTRSIRTVAWVRWLLWNMPYHAEHHGWPGIPWYALPALHREIRGALPHQGLGILAIHWHRGRDPIR
jgi:fatty acid desaturase